MEKGKLIDAVEKVLENDIRAHTDVNWFVIQVLKEMGFDFWIDYKQLSRMPSFESILSTKRYVKHKQNKYNDVELDPNATYN